MKHAKECIGGAKVTQTQKKNEIEVYISRVRILISLLPSSANKFEYLLYAKRMNLYYFWCLTYDLISTLQVSKCDAIIGLWPSIQCLRWDLISESPCRDAEIKVVIKHHISNRNHIEFQAHPIKPEVNPCWSYWTREVVGLYRTT